MKRILYITYDGLLDPLGQNQILPYILGLNSNGYKFVILSFEKDDKNILKIINLKRYLNSKDIIWVNLTFKSGIINIFSRFLRGAITTFNLSKRYDLSGVHLRGAYPGIIFLMSFINNKVIYDLRAFLGQSFDCKRLPNFWPIKFVFLYLEKIIIKNSQGIVILDESAKDFLRKNYNYQKTCKVIPTSTDLSNYTFDRKTKNTKKEIKFVFLGGGRYPYLPIQAIKFFIKFSNQGFRCSLDFINEKENLKIKQLIEKSGLSQKKCQVKYVEPALIPKVLSKYDCGLVFIDKGKWLSMCSPTKIGEYLAAGLHIVGLQGIHALDRLSKNYYCADLINPQYYKGEIINLNFNSKEISENILSNERQKRSINVAKRIYDLKKANDKYLDLYKKLEL